MRKYETLKNKNLVLVQSKHKNWILDFIAKDLCNLEKCDLVYVPSRKKHIRKLKGWIYLPRSPKMVVFHQDLFIQLYKKGRIRECSDVILYYTHSMVPNSELSYLRKASKIIVMSKQARQFLETNYGIPGNKIEILYGGVDTKRFFHHAKVNQKVAIFVCDYKARKRPDLILRTVEDNKDWKFILHGLNWNGTEELNKLKRKENFIYSDFSFQKSNELYGSARVFISLSDIEGGPLPAIEALICGNSLILTDTGFAKDLTLLSSDVQVLPVGPTSTEVTHALERTINRPSSRDIEVNYKQIFDYDAFLHQIMKLKTEIGKQ